LHGKDILQCAEVKHSKYRQWFRLVGLGYDLQVWRPDTRVPAIPCKFPYSKCSIQWVKDIIDPWLDKCFKGIDLIMNEPPLLVANPLDEEQASIYFQSLNSVNEKIKNTINKVNDAKYDHYNLYKLRKLNLGL
jgi:hypothetical protein